MATTQTQTLMRCESRYFGTLEYHADSIMEFPDGIPAFEHERRFLAVRQPINAPLVFLQSLADPNLCFATLPVQHACPGFRLHMTPEDRAALGFSGPRQPLIGRDVLCLAILSFEEHAPPTANLLAPLVVNLRTQQGRQAIQVDSRHSHREALPLREAACS
ncbi:MAG TPA: flagellar assembly protein FliW [Bryobacteraceae bacterium]|nr:flagellar assembly protein FliW [Bryobacteraceae bacterium]